MRQSDVTIEIRDASLRRVGIIPPKDLDAEITAMHNDIGSSRITVPADSLSARLLGTTGAGVIVCLRGEPFFSGPILTSETSASANDENGMVTFNGPSDTIVLQDRLAFPEPSNPDAETQNAVADKRTGPAESVIHAFVRENIGKNAPPARRVKNLVNAHNQARGKTTTLHGRFASLFDTIYRKATSHGFGFRVIQRGEMLVFETYLVTDRRDQVTLSVSNRTLSENKVSVGSPTVTRVIVKGEKKTQVVTTPESLRNESLYGRRIERVVDSGADDEDAGASLLNVEGFAAVSAQAIPSDREADRFGIDWSLGDLVAVAAGRTNGTSIASAAVLKVGSDGVALGVTLGDPAKFDPLAKTAKAVKETKQAVKDAKDSSDGNGDDGPSAPDEEFNTGYGYNALVDLTTGGGNAQFGATTLGIGPDDNVVEGSNNTLIGIRAHLNKARSNGTALGYGASSGDRGVALGAHAKAGQNHGLIAVRALEVRYTPNPGSLEQDTQDFTTREATSLVLSSEDGTRFYIGVTNAGVLSVVKDSDPQLPEQRGITDPPR